MSHAWWLDRPLWAKLAALIATGSVSLGLFAVIAVGEIVDTGGAKGVLVTATGPRGQPWKPT